MSSHHGVAISLYFCYRFRCGNKISEKGRVRKENLELGLQFKGIQSVTKGQPYRRYLNGDRRDLSPSHILLKDEAENGKKNGACP